MYNLRESIIETVSCDYANNLEDVSTAVLDCSLGVNPYGMNEDVVHALRSLKPSDISHYPHDDALLEKIAERFRTVFPEIKAGNILLANGSIDILRKINMAVAGGGGTVMGVEPRFSAYVDDLVYLGAGHTAYSLKRDNNYRFDTDGFLEQYYRMPNCRMVCIENPHNPTGQIIPLEEIKRIASAAAERDSLLVVDEAYGDYMPLESSAAALVSSNPNVVVTRSFSKGYGMAGVRLGYLIGQENVVQAVAKIFLPFDCNSVGRFLGMRALEDKEYCLRLMERVKADKNLVLSKIKKLCVAETSPTVPIMMVYHPDASVDLYRLLLQNGIKTISGEGYRELSKNCVRMLVCAEASLQADILEKIEKEI